MPRRTPSGRKTAVADVEGKLQARYPGNPGAVYGVLNKVGLMKGSKVTAKGRKAAPREDGVAMSTPVAGALAVTPLYATAADQIVSWDDPGATWRQLLASGAPLGPGGGGTGTSTVFTAGSVVFAGAGGIYAQDNQNLFWADTSNRLGVGTASPACRLDTAGTIRATGSTTPTAGAGIELLYNGGVGYLISYDRSGLAGHQLYLSGSSIALMDGNVGIGTASPGALLEVGDGTGQKIARINAGNSGTGSGAALFFAGAGGNHSEIGDYSAIQGGAYNAALNINSNNSIVFTGGNVGIGTAAPGALLAVNGTAGNPTGVWSVVSAREMKQEIARYERGLEAIRELNPCVFRYRPGTPYARSVDEPSDLLIGLIADEVEPHVPEIVGEMTATVREAERTVSTLQPGLLVFSLINAVKTLAEQNAALAARVAALETA